MATARNLSGVTSDPGTKVNPIVSGQARATDFVVGRYDEFGGRKESGQVVGGVSEASRLKKLMLNSMSNRGGALLPGFVMTENGPVRATKNNIQLQKVGKAKVKKTKVKIPDFNEVEEVEEVAPVFQVEPSQTKTPTFPIVFSIESGKIKSQVDAILEDNLAVALVFKDEENISYVPEKGSTLKLILPGNRELEVFYLGVQLPWYLSNQQILLFIKPPIE